MRALRAGMLSVLVVLAALAGAAPASAADAGAGTGAAAQDPAQLVQSSAEELLKELDANRAAYRKDPQLLRGLVDKSLMPHFDVAYAARLVLGMHNREITPEQRQRFIEAFENSLLQNYGSALIEFTANRLKVLPSHVDPNEKSTTVRTEIRRDEGDSVQVDYTLHMTPEGWKAWDVVIQGISYVKSFRDDVGAQIDQQGIEAVIQRLQRGGISVKTPAGAKKS